MYFITNYLRNAVIVIYAHRGNRLVEKFESKIVRLGDLLRIAIPPELLNSVELDDQTHVTIFVNNQGNLEIEVQGTDGPKSNCSICGHHKASRKCLNCGRHVCTSCFWVFGSLCKKCAKKVK